MVPYIMFKISCIYAYWLLVFRWLIEWNFLHILWIDTICGVASVDFYFNILGNINLFIS